MKDIILTDQMRITLSRFIWKVGIDECWLWIGRVNKYGYGMFSLKMDSVTYRSYYAHRVVYLQEYGPFDWELKVCHKCDVPACCNPKHLFLGTDLDNMRDRDYKGRRLPPIGEKNGFSKLTQEEVEQIRDLAPLKIPHWIIAEDYGVTRSTIDKVMRFETWKI